MTQLPDNNVSHMDHTIAPAQDPPPAGPPTDVAPAPDPQPAPEPQPDPPSPAYLEPEFPSEPPPPDPPAPHPGYRDALKNRGIDLEQFADEDAAMDYVASQIQAAGEYQQAQPLLQYAKAMLPYATQIDEMIEQQRQGQAPQQPTPQQPGAGQPAPEKPYWGELPEWDPAMEQLLETNAEGVIVVKPGGQPDLAHRYNKHRMAWRANIDKVARDPYACVEQPVRKLIQEEIAKAQDQQAQVSQAQITQQRTEQLYHAIVMDNQDLLLQKDAQGRVLTDPQTGQQAFTPQGRAYHEMLGYLMRSNMDPALVPQAALQMVTGFQQAPPAPQQPTGQQPGTPPNSQPAVPGTSTPMQTPTQPSQAQLTKDQFAGDARFMDGVLGGPNANRAGSMAGGAQPGGPPPVNPDAELATMLEHGFDQAGIK